jgi:hypothetical protein
MSPYRALSAGAALLAGTTDWQPVVLATAALIVAATPSVVGLIVSLGNRARIAEVQAATNSHLSNVTAEVAALRRQVADQQTVIVAQAVGKDVPK